MNPKVAVAILNFNGRHHLKRFLPFVMAATYSNKTIWVIDNGSTDHSVEFLQTAYPDVHIVKNNANLGFAQGYNQGLSQIEADYFIILNNDAEVRPDFIEPVINLMENDKKIAFVQPKLLDIQQRDTFEYAGAAGGLLDALGYPFCRGRVLEHMEKDTGQYERTEEVFWATGCCLFARAEVYKMLGGFYPYLFIQNEDIDLCWQAQNMGYKVIACSQSVIYHTGGGCLEWINPKKMFLTFRNNMVILARNMPVVRLLWLVPCRFLLDMLAAIRYLLIKKPKQGWAIVRAWGVFINWFLFYKDKKWPTKRGLVHCSGFYSGSIIWQYFVRNNKIIRLKKQKQLQQFELLDKA